LNSDQSGRFGEADQLTTFERVITIERFNVAHILSKGQGFEEYGRTSLVRDIENEELTFIRARIETLQSRIDLQSFELGVGCF
jgi:hypothetical protein